jgi:hypothetical protein
MSGNKFRPLQNPVSNTGDGPILTGPIDLKCKIFSPISLKSYRNEKIGLGFVAAMENSGDRMIRYDPIPVTGDDNSGGEIEEMDDILEEYTYVTSHGPDSYTRVYFDGGRYVGKNRSVCLFHISPVRFGGEKATPDFLSFCHLCKKTLDGKDVYIYRGDEAFCSPECRNKKIIMDERKARSTTTIAVAATTTTTTAHNFAVNSPYTYGTKNDNRQIFSLGITAV